MLNERQKVLADVLLSLEGWTTRKELLKIPEIRIAYPNDSRNGIYFSVSFFFNLTFLDSFSCVALRYSS